MAGTSSVATLKIRSALLVRRVDSRLRERGFRCSWGIGCGGYRGMRSEFYASSLFLQAILGK